ncbi:transposable element Tcb2 transposase [Trichonephila clavipes]|nr:transposable element Tcb2 transposase [Trichonephila clavipes]
MRLFRGAFEPDFNFMEDNAQPHRATDVQQLLEKKSEDITHIECSAFSSDLNPQNMYGRLWKDALRHDYIPPGNTQQLKLMLVEEWAFLLQKLLNNLVLSMEKRCEATIAVTGVISHTKEHLIDVLSLGLTIMCNDSMN